MLIDLLSALDPALLNAFSFTGGGAFALAVAAIVTRYEWSPKFLFYVTREIMKKQGLVGIAQSLGTSLLIDAVKMPFDLVFGIARRIPVEDMSTRKQLTQRQRSIALIADTSPAKTVRQAFARAVLENRISELSVDLGEESPRVYATVVLKKEDAPWLI